MRTLCTVNVCLLQIVRKLIEMARKTSFPGALGYEEDFASLGLSEYYGHLDSPKEV